MYSLVALETQGCVTSVNKKKRNEVNHNNCLPADKY